MHEISFGMSPLTRLKVTVHVIVCTLDPTTLTMSMSVVTTATGQVIMHPVVSKSLKIWATTLGRDKVCHLISYLA